MARIKQSRPDTGLGSQVKVLKVFQGVPSSLGSGGPINLEHTHASNDGVPRGWWPFVCTLPPARRVAPNRQFSNPDVLAGRGEFASARREMARLPSLLWSTPEDWWWQGYRERVLY